MNVLWLMAVALVALILGYRYYSRYLATILGEDPSAQTPAVCMQDGRDYCPTRSSVVFAHHFASIAGAGPVLGPTMALLYGALPVWLWAILGGIFIGAVHDYVTLFVSIREKGHSVAEIARKSLGDAGFALMIGFTIVLCILVTSAFLVASAVSLTSLVSLDMMRLPADQTLLKTVVKDGVTMGPHRRHRLDLGDRHHSVRPPGRVAQLPQERPSVAHLSAGHRHLPGVDRCRAGPSGPSGRSRPGWCCWPSTRLWPQGFRSGYYSSRVISPTCSSSMAGSCC